MQKRKSTNNNLPQTSQKKQISTKSPEKEYPTEHQSYTKTIDSSQQESNLSMEKKELPSSLVHSKKMITTNKTYTTTDPCPCESGLSLGTCCGQYFDGIIFPSTPEQLLRSRYVAHVTHNHKYLIDTTHEHYKHEESEADITKWIDQLEWKGFTILTSLGGKEKDTTASIAFIVHFLVNGTPQEMKETAHFIKENGRWLYTYGDVEGHITYRREQPKVGRNELCPCGSGKKYKKCCLLKQ